LLAGNGREEIGLKKPVRPGRMIAEERREICSGNDSEELLETKVLGKPM